MKIGRAMNPLSHSFHMNAIRLLAVIAVCFSSSSELAHAQRKVAGRSPAPTSITYVLAPTGNEARYRIREQLASLDFPNDAIGKTAKIEGRLMLSADGRIMSDSSRFTVDLASLVSDQPRRDNYVRRMTLKTDSFPSATFVPRSVTGLPTSGMRSPKPGDYTFDLNGDLTVRGVTRPAVWRVRARLAPSGEISGSAETSFTFAEIGLPIPRVASVLSVNDLIKLELDFNLVPQKAGQDIRPRSS